jgi:hypothetical protein
VSTFHLFIDFKAVCDTINREKLFEATKEFKTPHKSIGLVRATVEHVTCRIICQNRLEHKCDEGREMPCRVFYLT